MPEEARGYGDKHFMIGEELVDRLCGYAKLGGNDVVLEVGGGTGNLTTRLLEKAKKVYCIEKDKRLCKILAERFSGVENFHLMEGNALKLEFPEFNKIVSNLPYSISRKITEKLLQHEFDYGVLVYQKEFVSKLLAEPGSPDYRFITALVQSTAEVRVLEDIPPDAFDPQPNIWSSAIELRPKETPSFEYIQFLRQLFNHKNKRLRNILSDVPEEYCDIRPANTDPAKLKKIYGSVVGDMHLC